MKTLKILHLGWEFPPHNLGGLGVACHGLINGLAKENVLTILVLPRQQESFINGCEIIGIDSLMSINTYAIDSLLSPYMTEQLYAGELRQYAHRKTHLYGENLFIEVERYAHAVSMIAQKEEFDLIHAHDWMSFKAGMLAKLATNKPLITHVHATEFDRTGGQISHPLVYEIEKMGLDEADKVIAVSNYTKKKLVDAYHIPEHKIAVLHNAIEQKEKKDVHERHFPCVLFLGRLTLQKGPDYFIKAAQKVLAHKPEVKFILAGTGDMEPALIEYVCEHNLTDSILFTGHVHGDHIDRAYQSAHIFIMPSVSEPFGLTALEAMRNGTPTIISKQSGVSEVVSHVLKTDFWDINELAQKILCTLMYQELADELTENSMQEVKKHTWQKVAKKCRAIYELCLQGRYNG